MLQERDPTLQYHLSYLDSSFGGESTDSVITGVFIQTKYQRWKLANFHDMIGFDHKKSGVCTFGWNLSTPTVVDQEGHLHTTAYVFLCTEDHGSNRWTVSTLIDTCPEVANGTRAVLTDGFFLPSDQFVELLPQAKRVECKKHILSVDCPKNCSKAELADMTRCMWEIVVNNLLPKLENICFCDVKHIFTNGTTANSYTESMNSSMGRWHVAPSDSIVKLITHSLQKDAHMMKEEQQSLGAIMLNSIGLPIDSTWARACRGVFSDYITNKFEEQVKDSQHYHTFVAKTSTPLLDTIPGQPVQITVVVKRNIITEAERHIAVNIHEDGVLGNILPCPCPLHLNEGLPCRHIMAVVYLLTAQLSMEVSFLHIKHFFNHRWLRRVKIFDDAPVAPSTMCSNFVQDIACEDGNEQECEMSSEIAYEPENTQSNIIQTAPVTTLPNKSKRVNISFEVLRKEAIELCALAKQNQNAAQFVLQVLCNAKVQLLSMQDFSAPITVQSVWRTCGADAPDLFLSQPVHSIPALSTQRMAVVPAAGTVNISAWFNFISLFFFLNTQPFCAHV